MRFLAVLLGIVLGAIPGVGVIALGQLLTGGGDGMIPFGLGGIMLGIGGMIIGGVWGWRRRETLRAHRVGGLVLAIVAVASLAGLSVVAMGSPPDPIASARDCGEMFELLGSTGPQGELLPLPDLTDSQVAAARTRLFELEELAASESAEENEVCRRLAEELDSQSEP